MNTYRGQFDNTNWYQVWMNDEVFDPSRSQAVSNKSPDGFSFGFGGSGPSQLALAILLEETDDKDWSLAHFQDFKRDFIAGLPCDPGETWTLHSEHIGQWIEEIKLAKC